MSTLKKKSKSELIEIIESLEMQVQEFKSNEDILLGSEEKFTKTFNSSPNPMIITEIESGKIVDVNKTFEKLIKYSKEEIINKNVFELNLWGNIEDRENYIRKMKEDKSISNLEIKIRTKSGDIRDSLISGEILTIQGKPYLLTSGIDITERKLAEDALKEQLYLNQQILETTLDGYILADSDGKIIDVNPAYCDMIGYTWEELLDMNIRELEVKIPPDEVDRRIKQMIRMGGDRFETQHKHKDGSILELDTSTSIMYIDETPMVAAFMRGITERKKAEELIKENERRLATLMSNLPGMAYKCKNDPNWTMEFISDGGYSLTGYHAKELVGSTQVSYADIIHPEDRQMVWENVQDALEKKQPFQLTYRITTASGNEKWVWEQGQAIYGEENDVISLEGFITDITERKKAEKRIEFLRFITEQVTDSVISTDLDFKINWVNHAFINLYGYSSKEVLNRTPDFLNAEPLSEKIQSEIFNAVLSGNTWKGELINRKKNGSTFLCELLVYPLRDKNGNIFAFAGHQRDITERKNAERKLRDSRNQLRSLAERLQMIREEERATVAREIHDDLGQTLTALKMDIAWMKKNAGMTEEMRAAKFDTMLGLTDSSIQTVKRIATELRPGILDDLGLISAIEWGTEEFQKRSGIECNLVISVEELAVDENVTIAVFRIFQESLTNIARHSGATKIEVTIKKAGDLLQMEITDNGVGISEEQINSSKSLGLIGMNERASVFGGKLKISREASGGTTVRVYIPIGKA
jgi:PAS domain S-box-containing protein